MASAIVNLATMVESQSLNAVVAGFSFASAVAWMDVVRWIISQVINVNKNGGNYYLLTALLTTVLAVVVYVITKAVAFNIEVNQPQSPIYAVTR
jgi:Family of unknown function (DUF5654)